MVRNSNHLVGTNDHAYHVKDHKRKQFWRCQI